MSLQNTFLDERCAAALSDERLLAAMARFEAALARATAPAAEAEVIARVCANAKFDAAALARDARRAGALTIPFVKRLTEQVAAESPDAARWVHFGATSQDVIDTAVVLCLKEGSSRVLELSKRLCEAAAALARKHAGTPMVSRTLLQPAVPVTFGWKAAVWLSLVARSHAGFRAAVRDASYLQLGGAGGTLSAFGDKGQAIAKAIARELELDVSYITWHSARDGFARIGAETAILAGAAGKVARDVSLMMQPEVGEAFEPEAEGKGGSSSMPHKRNPVGCLAALEAAQRCPGLASTLLSQLAPEHERGLGQWQSQFFTLRELLGSAASGLAAMAEVLEGLRVEPAAMLANLERSKGLVYSEAVSLRLGSALGKMEAHALTEKLCREAIATQSTLEEVLRRNPAVCQVISPAELPALFDPTSSLGSSKVMIDRALELWKASSATSPSE